MPVRLVNRWKQVSLARQFMPASPPILILATAAVGWWVGREIADILRAVHAGETYVTPSWPPMFC